MFSTNAEVFVYRAVDRHQINLTAGDAAVRALAGSFTLLATNDKLGSERG